jgi:uncharacterized protein YggE
MNIRNKRAKLILVVTMFFLVMFVFTPTGSAESVTKNQNATSNQTTPRVLLVTGSADVMVIPDEAIFTLAVETTNMNIMEAKSKNDISIKKIRTLAQELKIEAKYVKTDYISVNPQYTYKSNGENIFNGYVIHRGVVITLKDLSKFDELFTRILAAGANYVQNVQFMTTQLRKHKDEARALAVKAAKEKAVAMAKGLGQTIGKANLIQEIQEDSYSYYSPWGSRGYGGANSVSNVNAASNSIVNAPETSSQNINNDDFSPGQIKVSARISVTFDLN